MTGSTRKISEKKQAAWWVEAPRRAFLLIDGDAPIGFVYLKRRGGVNYITLGLTEARRGEGLGTLLYWTFKPCYAEILSDNTASIRAARRAGYRQIPAEADDKTVVLAS
jgi:RimJ/RimL family protein N-acetyltransferase